MTWVSEGDCRGGLSLRWRDGQRGGLSGSPPVVGRRRYYRQW
jgi:hypothetical protein